MLTLSNLLIGHAGTPLTTPLSAALEVGRLAVLTGRNGTGKSTLLRTLCGLQQPMAGNVSWNGKNLSKMKRKELARGVAIVLTTRPDTGMLSVRDVVALGRMPYTPTTGRLSERDKAAIDRAITLCALEDLQTRILTTLSDGERQRVMIAKALAQETPAILLDEPTGFLDYVAKEEVFDLLKNLAHTENKLILLATHDLTTSRRYADTVWHLTSNGLQTGGAEFLDHIILHTEHDRKSDL